MKYAKIIVKSNYEKRGDLVLRSYIRALRKYNLGALLDGENAFIYGIVDDNNKFHELFTNNVIDYDNCIMINIEEYFEIINALSKKAGVYNEIIKNVLFNDKLSSDFEISTMEDLAKDRAIEFEAYNRYMSRINPYQRVSDENPKSFNDYNNFLRKVEEINVMKKMDQQKIEKDEYEVSSYQPKPPIEEDYEYLVFEIPKTKVLRK